MDWGKLLRRTAACFLAALALWALASAGDLGSWMGKVFALGAEAGAVTPGKTAEEAGNFWENLLLRQSPYLVAGQVLSAHGESGEGPSPVQSVDGAEPDGELTQSPSGPSQDQAQDSVKDPAAEEELPLPQAGQESQNVVARTMLPATDGSYLSAGGVFLYNRTSQAVDMEALADQEVQLAGEGVGPQILIIHTHATEAYTQSEQDVYEESDPYRTTDDAHNVVRVGDEMAAAFAQAGLNVLHDRTLHDYPNYNGAYTRSRDTVEAYLAAFPSISVVLDVHRDALMGSDGSIYKVVADPDTVPGAAQVMLVVGTQEGGGSHPNWKLNLTFAMALERQMNQQMPTLARPIVLRKSHYNQFLSPGSLLVEVGTHGNTLQEAIAGARAFAQISAPVIADLIT